MKKPIFRLDRLCQNDLSAYIMLHNADPYLHAETVMEKDAL